ncbi:unnamed protein product [Vitrella brassicaformis CCMP3155]|uniref:DUF192 domain-containing protein n=1 Tax=Vitrella brassicaformis (strain CCMP3155) TaxID=1169540 RepID=A0A0G4EE42_VITBC|nr:unnamed protein product [Vitrella brassicaformis CCMP3155]|eukprot:CEL93609.1 unnamed protein product [Vitrella brassicaformis CCMP3155]
MVHARRDEPVTRLSTEFVKGYRKDLTVSVFDGKAQQQQQQQHLKYRGSSIIVPRSYEEYMTGLMHKRDRCGECGMVFIYRQDGTLSFIMDNTHIDLDMVFVNSDNVIVDIQPAKARQDGVISSTRPASYNIELMGGVCRERGIQVGDRVHFDWHIPCSDSRGNGNDASGEEVCFKA